MIVGLITLLVSVVVAIVDYVAGFFDVWEFVQLEGRFLC